MEESTLLEHAEAPPAAPSSSSSSSPTSSSAPPSSGGGSGGISGDGSGDVAAANPFPARRRSSSYVPAASVKGVVFNLMNAVIGVGVLAMPFCFKRAGWLFAPLLLLLVGGLTERSLSLMVRAGDILRDGDGEKGIAGGAQLTAIGYSATVARCYGPRWGNVTDMFIVVMNFGSAVAYMDVIADILGAWGANKVTGLLLVVAFIIGPLSCIREIENLKFTSLLGLSIYATFGLIVIVLFFVGVNCAGEKGIPAASADLLVAVPIQTLAFACHTVVFPVYREFKEAPGASSESFQFALRLTIGACLTMYVLVGFFGALTFGDNTLGDVLKNYSSEGGGLAHFIEAIFAFSICMTYPLLVFPMRDSLDLLIMKTKCAAGAARSRGWSSEQFGKVRFFGLTVLLIALAFLVAVLIPDVEVVFGLTGCTFGIVICFLLPALMFLRASGEDTGLKTFETGPDGGEWQRDRKTAIGVLVVGSLMGFASLIMTLASLGAEVEDQNESGLCNSTPPVVLR